MKKKLLNKMKIKYLIYGALFLLPAFLMCSRNIGQDRVVTLSKPITGSWGDQGDGTFHNPILNSNYPDSDVEKFGDKWYMISSKGQYMKGMTILESEDMVNWKITGGIVDSISWESSGDGVWAGDLAYHEGYWYCYFIDFGKGLFVSRSEKIEGPWSEPSLMLEKSGMTDPAVYWDHDKKEAYLICNYHIEKHQKGNQYFIKLFRMNWDGTEIIDKGKLIYSEIGAEAPKVYKVKDYYYIFISEWTVDHNGSKDDRRQIVLRSTKIDGPYERKVLLEKDPITKRSSCQGALIQVNENDWWYMHQLVQSKNTYEGRPQCLIPVRWEDNWPVLGEDVDGNGINNTVWHNRKPIQGKPVIAPQTDDDFNSPELNPQWLWDGNPVTSKWSLSDKVGFLRLYACAPKDINKSYQSLPNKVLQRKMGHGKDTVTVKMQINGMEKGQKAGLLHIAYNFATIGIECTPNGNKPFVQTSGWTFHGDKFENEVIYLRSIANERKIKFEYSSNDSEYKPLGESYIMESRGFNGIFIGMYSMNNTNKGYVDFDWFSYVYDGPKSEKLVTNKNLNPL